MPERVYMELNRKKTNPNVKNNLKLLIDEGFVEIEKIEFASQEYYDYTCMIEGYWTDDVPIGFGEAAAMALALKYNGIVASNNLSDVSNLAKLDEVPILTFSMIMSFCLELNLMSRDEINSIWKELINNTNQKLPKNSFDEYYPELFKNDCIELLKNYDFKKHYNASKKIEKAKI